MAGKLAGQVALRVVVKERAAGFATVLGNSSQNVPAPVNAKVPISTARTINKLTTINMAPIHCAADQFVVAMGRGFIE